ncbi:MAG: DUF2752 domain-containing protein [Cyanobacteria bacterium P01_E01_bin.6]
MDDVTPFLKTTRDRIIRWVTLGACVMPLGGAYLYNWGFRLSEGPCLFQQVFGFPSPSCGMTRSFMAIARGDLATALSFHAFGPLMFAAFLATAVHASIELIAQRAYVPWYKKIFNRPIIPLSVGFFFVAYYSLRLYVRYSSGNFHGSVFHTALWESLVTGAKAL